MQRENKSVNFIKEKQSGFSLIMSNTYKHKKRWKLKQRTQDWFCLDRYFELHSPSKSYKNSYRRSHKAKQKQAVKDGRFDTIPIFKKCHRCNWIMDW